MKMLVQVEQMQCIDRRALDAMSLDQAVATLAFAKTVAAEYEGLQVEVPEWLLDSLRSLKLEIKSRLHDQRAKTLREKQRKLDSLKPTEVRRAELEKEIQELSTALKAGE